MKLQKGFWKKVVAVFIMTTVVAYFIAGFLRMLQEKQRLVDNLSDFKGTYQFILTTDPQLQMVLGILSITFFGFMITKIGGKKGYELADEHGVHGTARWGRVEELKEGKAISTKNKYSTKNPFKTLSVEDGIILGKVPDKDELVILPINTSVSNGNVFGVGSSGAGKGQSVVYNNIVNNTQKTMIITDPKGELYNATHQLKRDQGFEVFQIDFLNLDQARYNPLDYVKDDIDAKRVAETIAKNSAKDDKQDHWFVKAVDLFTGIIIYVKSINPNASIPVDVKNFFNKANEDENFITEICNEIGTEHPAYQYLKDASVAKGNERASIMSTFTKQTGIFSSFKVANLTTTSDFNFHEFQKRKSILYVKIPMKANPVESLTATFFDQIITVLYDIADSNEGILPIKTMFLLDEFANLGKINDYEGTLSTCRGLGIEMFTIVQDIAQLENKYGKEVARTIISNHDTKLFLRTGDIETAKYFSGLAGETTARMKTASNSQSGGIFTNNSSASKSSQEQYVKRPLITEGELMNIKNDDCYVFIMGYYPLKLEKAWQYKIYGDFLFSKDRKPNYLKYRKRYLKFIGEEITPIHSGDSKNQTVVDTYVEDETSESDSTGNLVLANVEKEQEEEKEIIITPTIKSSPIKEGIKEEEKLDDKFNLFAQEFLMNGFNMVKDQNEELAVTQEEITNEGEVLFEQEQMYEEIDDIDAKKELLELFSNSDDITQEMIEEEEISFEDLSYHMEMLEDPEQTIESFMEFVNDSLESEKDI